MSRYGESNKDKDNLYEEILEFLSGRGHTIVELLDVLKDVIETEKIRE